MKIFNKLTLTHLIYAGILVVALTMRLVNLNEVPLANNEAQHALCTLDGQRGGCEGISRLYTFFTSIIFTLFGANNFSSRVVPAIIGSLIVLIPPMLDSIIERKSGIVLAICLALDPILIQTSRAADGTIIGIVFILYLMTFLLKQDWLAVLVMFGFGSLSGASFWLGLAILGATYAVTGLLTRKNKKDKTHQNIFVCPLKNQSKNKTFFVLLLILWIGISTRMLTDLAGLLSPLNSLAAIFTSGGSLAAETSLPTDVRLIVFCFYSFYAIIFSFSAFFHAVQDQNRKNLFLLIWILLGMVIFLIPQFSFYEAAWICIPMWALAASSIVQIGKNAMQEKQALRIPILVGIAILVFLSLQIVRLHYLLSVGLDLTKNLILLVAPILLCILFILLYGYGWSKTLALRVVSVLFLFCGAFALLRNANRAANLTGTIEYELVRQGPFLHNSDILIDEIENYRITNGALPEDIHIALSIADQTESMEWLLKNYSVDVVSELSDKNTDDYEILILDPDSLQSFSDYYSQDLALSSNLAWIQKDFSGFLPDEILEWLIYRGGTLQLEDYTLWFKL
ncbi:MAG: hypothetical protein C4545_06715 [Anaerolineaceae bacterium]|jgi:hypothetical protein|nr:MAG: hypothetical protein C4545_06715 [Anaerolineaceae bacterium]